MRRASERVLALSRPAIVLQQLQPRLHPPWPPLDAHSRPPPQVWQALTTAPAPNLEQIRVLCNQELAEPRPYLPRAINEINYNMGRVLTKN